MKNPFSLLERRRLFNQEHRLLVTEAVDEGARLSDLATSVGRAAALSPFYREHLAGIPATTITSLAALRILPFTTKNDLLAGPDRAVEADYATTWGTSGASGQPFVFGVDQNYATRHESSRAAIFTRAGLPKGATVVEILPGLRTSDRADFSQPRHRRFVVGYARPDLVELVVSREPDLVYGNRSHLIEVLDGVEAAGRPFSVSHVVSSSEMLLEGDRERLQQVLGAKVHDLYGSAEASNIAFRLDGESTWSTLSARVVVEVVHPNGDAAAPGETGEIVVTTLREPTSPMIRYRTGDLATVAADASGPADGRADIRFDHLEGRVMDALVNASGQASVSSWGLSTSRFWANGVVGERVHQWQIAQQADRSVDVTLVLRAGALDELTGPVTDHVQAALGPVAVRLHQRVEPYTATAGKFRAITSEATLD